MRCWKRCSDRSLSVCSSRGIKLTVSESIPLGDGDAWSGLGMDGETLEAKVVWPTSCIVIVLIFRRHSKRRMRN